jgi:hypothetical protein
VSPNSSATLSSFASGGWYADTAGFFLQGDVGTKVKTPSSGKNIVGELCKLLLWRGCASSIISQSSVHTWSPTSLPTLFLKSSQYISRSILKSHLLIFRAPTERKQKQQIINNTMPTKYQKKYFRVPQVLNTCNSSKILCFICRSSYLIVCSLNG